MSKAMIILDEMPVTCVECPFRIEGETIQLPNYQFQKTFRCRVGHAKNDEWDNDIPVETMGKKRMKWCPMKEVEDDTDN